MRQESCRPLGLRNVSSLNRLALAKNGCSLEVYVSTRGSEGTLPLPYVLLELHTVL